jgi:hypothetical protein
MSVSAPYGSLDATGNRPTRTLRTPSLTAGTALLLMTVLSALADFEPWITSSTGGVCDGRRSSPGR